jgi:hypothetical protein
MREIRGPILLLRRNEGRLAHGRPYRAFLHDVRSLGPRISEFVGGSSMRRLAVAFEEADRETFDVPPTLALQVTAILPLGADSSSVGARVSAETPAAFRTESRSTGAAKRDCGRRRPGPAGHWRRLL